MPQRKRGRILNENGLKKLEDAIWERFRDDYTKQQLSELTGLDADTVTKILRCEEGVDKRSIKRLFSPFGLQLHESNDLTYPPQGARSHSVVVPQPQELAAEETAPQNPDFVGREEAIKDLGNLVSNGTKIIGIYAKGGVGKTTLAREFLKHRGFEPLKIRIGMQTQDITPVEKWIQKWLKERFAEEPEPDFGLMLQQLKSKLQIYSMAVLIDNLEPALDDKGKFIQNHRRYVELLTLLAEPDVQSITLITSRERLNESKVTVHTYKLASLAEAAWRDFFGCHNIVTNSPAFSEMHKAYGGNAKAMEILCGVIRQEPYEGDLEAYWQENKIDLLIERDLEDLVSSQFNRLQKSDYEAYKLLYRLGIYRYEKIPHIPTVALTCLLWDVAEERRKRVIKSLQDRFLIEFKKDGLGKLQYWIHPVIQTEAISRLCSSRESANDLFTSMKKQIDLLLGSDDKLQEFLTRVTQKSFSSLTEVDSSSKTAGIRSYYFELCFNFIIQRGFGSSLSGYFSLDAKRINSLVFDYALVSIFNIASSFCIYGNNIKWDLVRDFNVNICPNTPAPQLQKILQDLRNALPDLTTAQELQDMWWKVHGKNWINVLLCIINYRKLSYALYGGLANQFNEQQHESLTQYYQASCLLVDCLNNSSDVSPEVRSHIEDTLLLPIAEIREIERHRGIN